MQYKSLNLWISKCLENIKIKYKNEKLKNIEIFYYYTLTSTKKV